MIRTTVCLALLIPAFALGRSATSAAADWASLYSDARRLSGESKYDSAIVLSREALQAVAGDTSLAGDTTRIQTCDFLGDMFLAIDDLDSALHYLDAAVSIDVRRFGDTTHRSVGAIAARARITYRKRDLQGAVDLYTSALTHHRGEPDLMLSSLYTGLGNCWRRAGELDTAMAYYNRSLDVYTELPDSLRFREAITLNSIGITYKNQLMYDSAEAAYERGLELLSRYGKEDFPFRATLYANLGTVHKRMNLWSAAERELRQALEINRRVKGDRHSGVASALTNLSNLSQMRGRLDEAIDYMEQALDIWREVYGEESARDFAYTNWLAVLYSQAGRYDEAASLLIRAHEMWLELSASQNMGDPLALDNLATTYQIIGRSEEAIRLHREYLAWADSARVDDPTIRALARLRIADVQFDQGDLAACRRSCYDALAVLQPLISAQEPIQPSWEMGAFMRIIEVEARLGRPAVADSLMNVALSRYDTLNMTSLSIWWGLAENRGHVAESREAWPEAISVYDSCAQWYLIHSAPQAPKYTRVLMRLGLCLARNGQHDSAMAALALATKDRMEFVRNNVAALSEANAFRFGHMARNATDAYFTGWILGDSQQTSDRTAADILINSKGLVSDVLLSRRRVARHLEEVELTDQIDDLRTARYQLASLFVQGMDGTSPDQTRQAADSLAQHIRQLEFALTTRLPEPLDRTHHVDLDSVQVAIPAQGALVEYLKIATADPALLEDQFAVLILRHDGDPVVVQLGPAARIEEAVRRYTDHLDALSGLGTAPTEADESAYTQLAARIFELTWAPLRAYLEGVQTVFVAPDGALNAVSFAGLTTADRSFLLEQLDFCYLTSGRDLLSDTRRAAGTTSMFALGDPQFDASPTQRRSAFLKPQAMDAHPSEQMLAFSTVRSACDIWSGLQLAPLPHTRREVTRVADQWSAHREGATHVYLEAAASEEAIKRYSEGHRVLHLATHGYFLSAQCQSQHTAQPGLRTSVAAMDNPLLLSGLCLAGAAYEGPEDQEESEDGFLTAQEIAELSLDGTELVVLSACESGRGKLASAEGVFGLRRAFLLAGARQVVSSLWAVSDMETADLMSQLYASEGQSPTEALREIQLQRLAQLRADDKPTHPVSWAAWVAVGVD